MQRLCGALVILTLWTGAATAGTMTAREYFDVLPGTIFESTPEGLPDEEKRQLLDAGRTEFWELRDENADMLQLASVPFGESTVSVRVFRNAAPLRVTRAAASPAAAPVSASRAGDDVIALGTQGNAICTIELWRADSSGRIVPVDTPDEPQVADFFDGQNPLPQDARISFLFCLEAQGLEAVPLFWNQAGMMHLPVLNKVRYLWENGEFHKRIIPLAH